MSEKIDQLKWQEQMDFSKAMIFRLPAGTANFLLASSILSTGLLLLLLYLQLFRSQPGPAWLVYLASLLFMAGAFYTFRSSLRFRDSIAVNDEGVLYISRYAKSAYLPWDEVASIGVHESQQRLVLRDATNQRKIRLEYQIEEFSKLREFVISHATAVQKPQGHGQNVFHRSWYNKCVFAAGAAFCFFLALHSAGRIGPVVVFLGFGVASLVLVVRDPTGIQITKHSIEITYLGWKRSVAFGDVTGISLKDVPDEKGNVWAAVILDCREDKPIQLFRFREGSLALRDALQSAWIAAGQ